LPIAKPLDEAQLARVKAAKQKLSQQLAMAREMTLATAE